MGAVDTTYTFTATDTITSSKMNNIIDQTTMTSNAIIGTTLEVSSGKLKVRSSGITSNELASGSVTSTAIADGTIVNAKVNASAAIDLSKLATGALPTAITIASANIVDGTIATDDLADASITAPKLDGAQSGSAPVYGIRAWVNFDAQSDTDLAGTYSRSSSTTVTITATSHGLIAGNLVFIDFTVGTGTAPFDGVYEVASVTDANTFTVTSSTSTASTGTAVLKRKTIRGSGNISCVSAATSNPTIPPTSNASPSNGYYIANFSIAMPSTGFAILGTCSQDGTLETASGRVGLNGSPYNEKCALITAINYSSNAVAPLYGSISIIG